MKVFNRVLVIIYILFFCTLSFFVFTAETKKKLHLAVNEYHSSFFDVFFKYATHLGDGIMFGVLIVLLFFKNKIDALKMGVAGGVTLLFTALFKKVVFKGVARPVEFIGAEKLHLIEGVKMAHWNSFPSGHTTAAFAMATILILSTKNRILQITYLFLAMLAGFSRVYLSQHFMRDVLVGSLLGILIGLSSVTLVNFIRMKRKSMTTS